MLVDNIRTGRLQSFLPNAELQHMAKHIHANILDACAQGYHAEVGSLRDDCRKKSLVETVWSDILFLNRCEMAAKFR